MTTPPAPTPAELRLQRRIRRLQARLEDQRPGPAKERTRLRIAKLRERLRALRQQRKTPTPNPTPSPTPSPSPTGGPTSAPTGTPTAGPTGTPTGTPTGSPTAGPTGSPTGSPTGGPTSSPTGDPTGTPTSSPTGTPTDPAGSRFFQHGVASGDPLPDSVVLWTRLTPTPEATPGSGLGPDATVAWTVAEDAGFDRVVAQGTVTTGPGRDHTVKVDATGLDPETWYHYRFTYRGPSGETGLSPVGRTRTAPAYDASPDHLRFGVVSCSNLQAGWFSAYRHLAERDDLHAVVHLGDYLYEYAPGSYGMGSGDVDVRAHVPAREMVSLADYRQRHAQYKQDPDLAALHAKYPFIVTWDDHETTNDAWSDGAENHNDGEGDWAERVAAAHLAYDEWMPVRMGGTTATGDGDRLYRRLTFGTLAELSLLDLRSYRSQQVSIGDPAVADADRSITGSEQMTWLKEGLSPDRPQWRLVGNPVMIAPITIGSLPREITDALGQLSPGLGYNIDQWDGYYADQREVLDHIADQGVRDVVFITGDIHSAWACDLPYDASLYPLLGGSAGVEFVCSSVTSNNLKDILNAPPRTASLSVETAIKTLNRHVRYLDFDSHGFSVLDLTPARAQMDWFVIGDRSDPDTPISWSTSWATSAGTGTVRPVEGPVA